MSDRHESEALDVVVAGDDDVAAARGGAGDASAAAGVDPVVAAAERSERFFVARVVAIVAVAVFVGMVGIWRVKQRSAGIRTAAQLAQVDDERREAIEYNRQLEAEILQGLDPVQMRQEASGALEMHAPDPDDQVEVP